MTIEEGTLLSPLTTFRTGGHAGHFARIGSADDLRSLERYLEGTRESLFVLGGGSNTLVADSGFDGMVAKIEIKGLDFKDDHDSTLLVAGAGEVWDEVVEAVVARGLWGFENLSGIPGTVGATPVQNIGAYGKEVASLIDWVEAFDRVTKKTRRMDPTECRFGYRDSIFKSALGQSLIITRVAYRLSKKGIPMIAYKDFANVFANAEKEPDQSGIREAILAIRGKKFPKLSELGTAGSFFKNPLVSHDRAEELVRAYPELPAFPQASGGVKVSAAWLIDRVANLRGHRVGGARSFENQALVIVAETGAPTSDVIALAKKIRDEVKARTTIDLEPEVVFVGCTWE